MKYKLWSHYPHNDLIEEHWSCPYGLVIKISFKHWTATVLTPAIVNDSTFGIGFQITTQSSGGSDRSFLNIFTATVYYTTLSASVTATPSLDPQVDTIDYYRMTPSLDNFTYAGSTPNTSVGFSVNRKESTDFPQFGEPAIKIAGSSLVFVFILAPFGRLKCVCKPPWLPPLGDSHKSSPS